LRFLQLLILSAYFSIRCSINSFGTTRPKLIARKLIARKLIARMILADDVGVDRRDNRRGA